MKTYLEWHYEYPPPKNTEVVAALVHESGLGQIPHTERAYMKDGKWYYSESKRPINIRVYAWAPLPTPPPVDIDKA